MGVGVGEQAHQLSMLAEQHGKGNEAQEAMFVAQYEQGLNISDVSVLLDIGRALHLPKVGALSTFNPEPELQASWDESCLFSCSLCSVSTALNGCL